MPKRVFIIHGWSGYPEEGWFPWLKKELEQKGFQVLIPAMPEPDKPRIDVWLPYLAKTVGVPDEQTFLVGHSIGCQTVLRYLEQLPADKRLGGAVLVAGWVHRLEGDLSPEELAIARPWLKTPLDLTKVKERAKHFAAIFSDNDQWVRLPEENENIFQNQLGAEIIIEHGRGHFSGSNGVTELLSARDKILEWVASFPPARFHYTK